ncbi:helix-turn-helix transcriptional regulator [Micromonospora sp. NPDC018662]|uniref:helix-turn-helix transcriptional regulator n=1 Tax=Micromonospora sp. NPDC018662 TaxID=3364238 RepID=UPI0037A332AD
MRLVALADVAEMLGGVSRTRATEIVRRPGFPDPLDVVGNGRMRIWARVDVEAWIKANRPHQHSDER